MNASPLKSTTAGKDYSVFRDSVLRYAGYANEVGESFRYQFPRAVLPSYVVAFGYCLSDATATGYHCYHRDRIHDGDNSASATAKVWKETFQVTADAMVWQTLASVLIPGATINAIVRCSRSAIQLASQNGMAQRFVPAVIVTNATLKNWFPTVVGLSSIPFIVKPIDSLVDEILDHSLRAVWKEQ